MIERLRQGPGDEAKEEVSVGPNGPVPSRWVLRTIRATFSWLRSYSLSGVWRRLKHWKIKLRSGRVQQYSPDPDYAEKVERLCQCLREAALAPGEVVVLFLDEAGYQSWPKPAPDWSEAAPAKAPLADRAKTTLHQWRIIGALNAQTGRVDHYENYVLGRRELIKFYRQLNRAYPSARLIYVVQDNWPVHRHPDVTYALEQLPRIQPIWLPTYAPWLNPIEKLWRWLRQVVEKMHRLADKWPAFQQRVVSFLDQFASGSQALLRYVGLLGNGKLAIAATNQ